MTSRLAAGAAVLALVVGPTCVDYDPGIEVEVVVLHHDGPRGGAVPEPDPAFAVRQLTTDLGYRVELARAYVVIEQVKLIACPEEPGAAAAARRLLWPRGLALAHGADDDPTLLGVPYVEDAMRADFDPGEIGTIRPPPGRYCQARVVIAPADDDAEALPVDIDMVGASLYLEGTYQAAGAAEPTRFVLRSSDRREAVIPLVDRYGGEPTPLVLDGGHRVARVPIGSLTNFWLDGIDFDSASAAERTSQALDDIAATLHHHPE